LGFKNSGSGKEPRVKASIFPKLELPVWNFGWFLGISFHGLPYFWPPKNVVDVLTPFGAVLFARPVDSVKAANLEWVKKCPCVPSL